MKNAEQWLEVYKSVDLTISALIRSIQADATPQWLPIESAPIDKDVLLWHPGSKHMPPGCYVGYMKPTSFGNLPVFGCTLYRADAATHWMPLPKPPEAK